MAYHLYADGEHLRSDVTVTRLKTWVEMTIDDALTWHPGEAEAWRTIDQLATSCHAITDDGCYVEITEHAGEPPKNRAYQDDALGVV